MKLSQQKREKIAIVVFILAILGIFAAVALYMVLTHTFDLAASDIDENVGQLNDYSAIVFEGNNVSRQKPSDKDPDKNQEQQNSDKYIVNEATTSTVSKMYQLKGATTAAINVQDFKAYENGEIIERGSWKIGVLSITQDSLNVLKSAKESADSRNDKTTPVIIEEFQKKINNLRIENQASMVILVSPDQSVLKYVSKIDCLVASSVEKNVGDTGKQVGDTFVMPIPAPEVIGAVVSSPAKMMSGNVFEEVLLPVSKRTK